MSEPGYIDKRDVKMNVLLVEPTSYLGLRLVQRFLDSEGVRLSLLVSDIRRLGDAIRQRAEIVEGDFFDGIVLRRALRGIDVAYFPIRFFGTDKKFAELGRSFAEEFREACIEDGVRRIVYLGVAGLKGTRNMWINTAESVGETLNSCPEKIDTIWFKTGFVVGAGSALFEVLRSLIHKSPVLLIPRWMERKITTIGAEDVLEYLVQAKGLGGQGSVIVDVGMPAMSFREMLTVCSRAMGLRRPLVPLPCEAYRLSLLLLGLLTPFSFPLASLFIRMIESGGNSHDGTERINSQRYFPQISPRPFEHVVEHAIQASEKDLVSRWTDSLAGISYHDDEYDVRRSVYRDVKKMTFDDIPPQKIFHAVKSIGGRRGWFTFNFLWQIRGLLDKFAGGFGTSVGRRVDADVRVGDMVDVWKVVDLREDRRLLLEAQMKVFGKAWLEFVIEGNTLIQTAYHYPRGLTGRLYWYCMLPFHVFIFKDMISAILRRAREED